MRPFSPAVSWMRCSLTWAWALSVVKRKVPSWAWSVSPPSAARLRRRDRNVSRCSRSASSMRRPPTSRPSSGRSYRRRSSRRSRNLVFCRTGESIGRGPTWLAFTAATSGASAAFSKERGNLTPPSSTTVRRKRSSRRPVSKTSPSR